MFDQKKSVWIVYAIVEVSRNKLVQVDIVAEGIVEEFGRIC